jgi:hypothetical protein
MSALDSIGYSQEDISVTVDAVNESVIVTDHMSNPPYSWAETYRCREADIERCLKSREDVRIAGATMLATKKVMDRRMAKEQRRWETVARRLDTNLDLLWEQEWPFGSMLDLAELLDEYDRQERAQHWLLTKTDTPGDVNG